MPFKNEEKSDAGGIAVSIAASGMRKKNKDIFRYLKTHNCFNERTTKKS